MTDSEKTQRSTPYEAGSAPGNGPDVIAPLAYQVVAGVLLRYLISWERIYLMHAFILPPGVWPQILVEGSLILAFCGWYFTQVGCSSIYGALVFALAYCAFIPLTDWGGRPGVIPQDLMACALILMVAVLSAARRKR